MNESSILNLNSAEAKQSILLETIREYALSGISFEIRYIDGNPLDCKFFFIELPNIAERLLGPTLVFLVRLEFRMRE